MMRIVKGSLLIIAGMLLWSLIWHGYWFAQEYMTEEPESSCTQVYCLT